MKQMIRIMLVCLLALVILTACQEAPISTSSSTQPTTQPTSQPAPSSTIQPTDPPHHCSSNTWEMDKDNHWMLCDECGKQILLSSHQTREDQCVDCKVNITVKDDQSVLLAMHQTYKRHPDWERLYDADGRLKYESKYTLDNNTNLFTVTQNYYYDDGRRQYIVRDHYGFMTENIHYDAQGNVTDSYTYTNKYNSNIERPSHVSCSHNGVLIYKEIYSTYGDRIYCNHRTDYRADGSYSVSEFTYKGGLQFYNCFNADGTPMDHSDRYDRDACKPLVGTWSMLVQSDTHTMGLYDLESRPIKVLLTYTFDRNGNLLISQDLDPTEHYQYRYDVEMMLLDLTLGEHPTTEEKEAACQAKFGMSLHDYVTKRLSGFLFEMEGHREQKGIYFVEDGQLYIADNWVTFEVGMDFVVDGDTLTLMTDYSPIPMSLSRVQADLSDYAGRFDPDICAPLFGTWTGTMKMDGSSMGVENSELFIMADFIVTFDNMGNMTMVMELDPEEFRSFSIQLAIEAILNSHKDLDRRQVEAIYKLNYKMSLEEYVTAQVDAQNPAANAFREWSGIYYVAEGLLYTVDRHTGELDSSPYSLKDGTLTMVDQKSGISLVLTKDKMPPEDLKAHEKFDANTCAPLFGVWECTQTLSTTDMGLHLEKPLSVKMTVRITFTQDGIQVMQMVCDKKAYYDFMLAVTVETIYMSMTADGMTREQVDAQLAQNGTSVAAMAAEQLSQRDLLPDDGYFCYYLENGNLYYGEDEFMQKIRITITGNTMTFHAEEGGEDSVFTKVG